MRDVNWGLGFGVYGVARAGILFGENRLNAKQTATVTDGGGNITLFLPYQRSAHTSTSVPYTDFEAGLDWTQNWRTVMPFARVGVVGQQWFDSGSPTSTINNKTGDLSLFGMQLTAGFKY